MAYCTSCGSEVESSDRFCRHCGAVAPEIRQAASDPGSGMREVTTNGTSDSEPDSRGPSAQVGADESSLADEKQQRVGVSEGNPESDGSAPRPRSRAKRAFVVLLACAVVAGAAGAVALFTNHQPDRSRNVTASQRKVRSCVTSIGASAAQAINDVENFDESAMSTVMAGFSVAHGPAEYAVLQSVVSDVSQNLMSARWAASWKSAINHELPTIASYCRKRYPPAGATSSTSTSTTSGTTTTLAPWCLALMAKSFIQAQSVKVNADGTATLQGAAVVAQCAPGTPGDIQWRDRTASGAEAARSVSPVAQ